MYSSDSDDLFEDELSRDGSLFRAASQTPAMSQPPSTPPPTPQRQPLPLITSTTLPESSALNRKYITSGRTGLADPNRPKRKYVRRKPTKTQLRSVELLNPPVKSKKEPSAGNAKVSGARARSSEISTQTCNQLEVDDDGFLMDISLVDTAEIVYQEYQALKRIPEAQETELAVENLLKILG